MNKRIFKGLIWKIPYLSLAIMTLNFEVDAYTNTRGSLGELFLYQNQEKAFLISSILIGIMGLFLVFIKNKTIKFIIIGLIFLIVLLFYPSFEMKGVERAF